LTSPYRTPAAYDPPPRVPLKGDILCVSDENLPQCAQALLSILMNEQTILRLMDRYPVCLEFADYRFCLDKPEHFGQLAVALECKMAEHRGRQSRT
jgi:hypothetical protein